MTIIEVEDLVKRYGERTVVHDVSFTVAEGEIFGILGPNGAGKTTTVESIEGLRRPDGGRIRVDGLDPVRDRTTLPYRLGVQLQSSELPGKLTVREALRLYGSFYPAPADAADLIESLRLADTVARQYRRLSGGQKQRLSIALALIGNPRVVVLDELTTGLDPQARRDVWDLIERVRDRGVTVLLVTHSMEEAERLCDRLAVIDSGRVVAIDTPAGLVSRVSDGTRLRFRAAAPLDRAALAAMPEVRELRASGEDLVVTGSENVVAAVTGYLAARGIVAENLRIERATLDDAFVALTGRLLHEED
ncbi:ABC transporter ATP-binding protein [Microbacterium sp. RD1]|uniref:ABC transporter ATP-binding protein n=1 Tax=Microbacterium sp. RD1 TaxID=3457313 RepID=UPI003FA5ABE3